MVTRRLIAAFTERAEPAFVAPAILNTLTDREREVLREAAPAKTQRSAPADPDPRASRP